MLKCAFAILTSTSPNWIKTHFNLHLARCRNRASPKVLLVYLSSELTFQEPREPSSIDISRLKTATQVCRILVRIREKYYAWFVAQFQAIASERMELFLSALVDALRKLCGLSGTSCVDIYTRCVTLNTFWCCSCLLTVPEKERTRKRDLLLALLLDLRKCAPVIFPLVDVVVWLLLCCGGLS